MKEILEDDENQQILQVMSNYPNGANVKDIIIALDTSKGKILERTLQRKLLLLIDSRLVIKTGHGRATRYYLNSQIIPVDQRNSEQTAKEPKNYKDTNIVLSQSSVSIQQYVTQSLQSRRPTGYHGAFLDNYDPNQTYYLSEDTRQHLKKIGYLPQRDYSAAATYSKKMISRLLIDLSWNSSRLEGNTYSLLETERLIVAGEAAAGKSLFETQMIINHKKAIEFLLGSSELIGFNRYTILNLHALLAEGLLNNTEACGRLRTIPVGIQGTVYHPIDIPQKMEEYFQKILSKAEEISDPYEQAFFPLVQLSYLQPFEDINKRVSRLSANIPLIKHNLCPLSFIDVPEKLYIDGVLGVYELNNIDLLKDVFVWAYERSALRYAAIQQSLGEPDPFRMHYRAQLQEIVAKVIKQNLNKTEASSFIQVWSSENIPKEDDNKFVEVVERELLEMHEGNFARYYILPSEFDKWQSCWRTKSS